MVSCLHESLKSGVKCPSCGLLAEVALNLNPFELLGLPLKVPIETRILREAHLALARDCHPDFNASHLPLAITLSAHVNHCRQTLADRLGALRELSRIKAPALSETPVSGPFLAEMMEACEEPQTADILARRLEEELEQSETLAGQGHWAEALSHMARAGYCRSLCERAQERGA